MYLNVLSILKAGNVLYACGYINVLYMFLYIYMYVCVCMYNFCEIIVL